MARKKKSVTDVAITQSSIPVVGNVVIKRLGSNGKVKSCVRVSNTATFNLLQGLGYHLIGDSRLGGNIFPKYLSVGFNSGPSIKTSPTMTTLYNEFDIPRFKLNYSNVQLKQVIENGIPVPQVEVLFSTVIPYQSVAVYSTGFNELGLYSDFSGNTLLARVETDRTGDPELLGAIKAAPGDNLLIEWYIILKVGGVR